MRDTAEAERQLSGPRVRVGLFELERTRGTTRPLSPQPAQGPGAAFASLLCLPPSILSPSHCPGAAALLPHQAGAKEVLANGTTFFGDFGAHRSAEE